MPDEQQDSELTGELGTLTANPDSASKTVAICDENNFCQDYRVICKDGEELSREPIEGATIQKPEDWIDDRDINYENLCKPL